MLNFSASIVHLGGDGFLGCTRDFAVNEKKYTLMDAIAVNNVSPGCAREQMCFSTSCNGQGVCVDLWNNYR